MKRLTWPVAFAFSLAAFGCGGTTSAPSVSNSQEEATVHGTVSVKGKPPRKGEIIFDPSNKFRRDVGPRSATIEDNGNYSVKTLVGENSVTVHSKAIDADPALSTNQRIIVVNPGDNTVPVELP